jgi:type I restriction enzyme R subunit
MKRTESENQLELNLINKLKEKKYQKIKIKDETDLLNNFKNQLQKLNNIIFTDREFEYICNHLDKGSIFQKSKILKDRYIIKRDNNENIYIRFFNSDNFDKNIFQVTNQVNVKGQKSNRYDVSVLINGLPLIHIELKKRGLAIREAFNQINRYHRDSFPFSRLFMFVQIFVVSNGVNTKYFANNRRQSFENTFYWTDINNLKITKIDEFVDSFLDREKIIYFIKNFIISFHTSKSLIVARPYQYYAVQEVKKLVDKNLGNGYIWHSTGSGKTVTSFKCSQIISEISSVDKVLFVVDRNSLDFHTTTEFNNYDKNVTASVDDTNSLVNRFNDKDKLIITTIQKLNSAITKDKFKEKIKNFQNKRIIFLFDECHRSQFGDTHLNIIKFFKNSQLIGFTGTPIFSENAFRNIRGKKTTSELFGKCLHRYTITDAINDQNVLKFLVEYVNVVDKKELQEDNKESKIFYSSTNRINKITEYIINNHNKKTYNRTFVSMMCVDSIDTLIKYYKSFNLLKHDLNIASIFTYKQNAEDKDADGLDETYSENLNLNDDDKIQNSKFLEKIIDDYNIRYKTQFSCNNAKEFTNYSNDISQKVKSGEIDILLVVDMFLTGFDAKNLNTLYVDKNLRFHKLVQAYSRTNRILNKFKKFGNIVNFRNLENETDEAIKLFANKENKDEILMKSYHHYCNLQKKLISMLMKVAPNVESIDRFTGDKNKIEFINIFKELNKNKNIMEGFLDNKETDLIIDPQTFENYKSKYLDLYEEYKTINLEENINYKDIDFEIDFIKKQIIDVDYILDLLKNTHNLKNYEAITEKNRIIEILNKSSNEIKQKDVLLDFIDKFKIDDKNFSIEEEYFKFANNKKNSLIETICNKENVNVDKFKELIVNFNYDNKIPLSNSVIDTLNFKPRLIERKKISEKLIKAINEINSLSN